MLPSTRLLSLERVRCRRQRLQVFPVMLVGKWNTTVATRSNFGLVSVDKDPRMSRSTTSTIAGDDPIMRPAHRLLMNELHGRVRLRLHAIIRLLEPRARHGLGPGLLAARPDPLAIGCLLDGGREGCLARDLRGSRFLYGLRNGGWIEFRGEGTSRGERHLARHAVDGP